MDSKEPFFSIVIPVFNRAHSLGGALESVFTQDWPDYEVIVVDDGSTDDIDTVIRPYQARGVTLLRNDENLGVGPTRNKGVLASHGRWIAFLDSDSYLVSGALSTLHSTIGTCDENVAVVYGKSVQIGVVPKTRQFSSRWGYKEFLQAPYIEEGFPVTRRELLLRFPFEQNLNIKRECGTLVWYAIGRAGYDFVWTKDVVQQYEISPEGLSGKQFLVAHPEEMVICNEKILQHFGDDLLRLNKNKLVKLHQKTAFYCIMAARRGCAIRHAQIAWKLDPINLRTWLVTVLCWIGPRAARRLYPIAASVGV
jgi:glycosyltransferase involved in cell wall biosynthesis